MGSRAWWGVVRGSPTGWKISRQGFKPGRICEEIVKKVKWRGITSVNPKRESAHLKERKTTRKDGSGKKRYEEV